MFLCQGRKIQPVCVGYFCGDIQGIKRGAVSILYLNAITSENKGAREGAVDVNLKCDWIVMGV
jgi:hypothetical protein